MVGINIAVVFALVFAGGGLEEKIEGSDAAMKREIAGQIRSN